MKNKNKLDSQEGVYTPEPRVYEFGYLLIPTVDEGNLNEERDALVALITGYKGIIISEGNPVLINLAYEMSKIIQNKRHHYQQAYFGWIKFDVTPDVITSLEKDLKIHPSLFRSLMIKTVRDNTIYSDQPFRFAQKDPQMISPLQKEDSSHSKKEKQEEQGEMKGDDLTRIKGIDENVEKILKENEILSFASLSSTKIKYLRDLLSENNLSSYNPKTWSKQATLAKNGKWDKLEELKSKLQEE